MGVEQPTSPSGLAKQHLTLNITLKLIFAHSFLNDPSASHALVDVAGM